MEDFAWRAFLLYGGIEAYLLHASIAKTLEETGISDGKNERVDNKAVGLR